MANDKIQTGLRLPEKQYEKIQEYADKVGVSLNSAILMLLDAGYKLLNGVNLPKHQ